MAPISTSKTQEDTASPSKTQHRLDASHAKSKRMNPPVDTSKYHLIHQVFRHRAAADPFPVPLLAFPMKGHTDYEYFNAGDLDRFTDSAAWSYVGKGLRTVFSSAPLFHHFAPFSTISYTDYLRNRMKRRRWRFLARRTLIGLSRRSQSQGLALVS